MMPKDSRTVTTVSLANTLQHSATHRRILPNLLHVNIIRNHLKAFNHHWNIQLTHTEFQTQLQILLERCL